MTLEFKIFAFQTNKRPELRYLPDQSKDFRTKTYVFGATNAKFHHQLYSLISK
jgi:hypothetical protein